MRLMVLAFVVLLATGSAALAAPTCNDAAGRTVRCGTPGAMPVGWTPSPQVLRARRATLPAGPSLRHMIAAACILGGLIALAVLLPDFEDGRGGGWDRQEDDEG